LKELGPKNLNWIYDRSSHTACSPGEEGGEIHPDVAWKRVRHLQAAAESKVWHIPGLEKQLWITGWNTASSESWQKELWRRQNRNRRTQQSERNERDGPWLVVITLSSEMMTTGERLGKTVGQEVLLEIQARMHQQV
jgi:hypothetical protein